METQERYDDQQFVRDMRAKFRRNKIHVVEQRERNSDRRIAFFSWVSEDRRIGERRKLCYIK